MVADITKTVRKNILIVAEHRIGHGSGHLHRCARIAPQLDGEVDWLLPEGGDETHYSRTAALEMIGNPMLPVRWVDRPLGPYDMVILDRREVSLDELRSYPVDGIVVGIDLAGEGRRYCSYLIDALESPPYMERPNIADSGLLHLPDTVREEWPERIEKVLVSFGGEHSGAGIDLATALAGNEELSVYLATREGTFTPEHVHALQVPGALRERLHEFDLVITHFGLTAYEALWARVPVIVKNPSAYHDTLSRTAGFAEARNGGEVLRHIRRIENLTDRCKRLRPNGKSDIAALINELSIPRRCTPPSGGERWQPAVARFAERTFFQNTDDLVYMQNYHGPVVEYTHDYFFSQYASQYGKTYLEDFPAIQSVGTRRIHDIKRHLSRQDHPPRLLDIGCAYGPFLQAAADARCDVTGIDISAEATEYVQRQLGFPAIAGDILDPRLGDMGGPFDIVTMWYVIEHFEDLDRLLNKVVTILKPGGLFAFSTPNLDGISGRSDRREFYRRSPMDHYTVMSPDIAQSVLDGYHLRKRSVRITGHHPERFSFVPPPRGEERQGGGYHSYRYGFRYRLAAVLSRLRRLGDTFEYIAEYRP